MENRKPFYIERIIASYYLFGGVISLLLLIKQLGLGGLVIYLLPSVITILILIFMIAVGLYNLFASDMSVLNYRLLNACLLIHTVQLSLMGFVFKNYFGPYLGIGFTDSPEITFLFRFRIISYFFGNGFLRTSQEISLVINLFPLLLLGLLNKYKAQ